MADPFAPLNRKQPRATPRPVDDHAPITRMVRLGMTTAEAAVISRMWAAMNDDARTESTAALAALTDAEVRQQVIDMRTQAHEEVPDGTVAEVLAWVGDDPENAYMAAWVEAQQRRPRATLLEELYRIGQAGFGG